MNQSFPNLYFDDIQYTNAISRLRQNRRLIFRPLRPGATIPFATGHYLLGLLPVYEMASKQKQTGY